MVALIAGKDSPEPGSPIWILNGKRNQLTDLSGGDGDALDFSWQHRVQFFNKDGTELILFDNHEIMHHAGPPACRKHCSK